MNEQLQQCAERLTVSARQNCFDRVHGNSGWTQEVSNSFIDGSWPLILAVVLAGFMIAAVLYRKL